MRTPFSRAGARAGLIALLAGAAVIAPAPAPAAEAAVTIRDNVFSPQELHVDPGDTVTWTHEGTRIHDVTSDTGDFLSGDMQRGSRFSHTFQEEGFYYYHCTFHGRGGQVGMWGVVVVGNPKPPDPSDEETKRPRIDVPADFPTIQAAVDAADPGYTIVVAPGNYRGDVTIATDDLVVRGVDRFRTILDGDRRRPHGFLVDGAAKVTIADLTVRGFTDSGIRFTGATHYTAARIDAIGNRGYGVAATGSYDGVVRSSFGWGSGAAAFHVGECMGCGALLDDVRAERSYTGYLGTNATGVTLRRSAFVHNAMGIASVSTAGAASAPGRGTLILDNLVADNAYADAPRAGETDAVPVPVGTGIWLAGVESNVVRDNAVSSHPRFGIVVTEAAGHAASTDGILANEVAGAGLFALAWDGAGTDVCFARNDFTGETAPPNVQTVYGCAARPFTGTPDPAVTEAVEAAIAEGAGAREGSRRARSVLAAKGDGRGATVTGRSLEGVREGRMSPKLLVWCLAAAAPLAFYAPSPAPAAKSRDLTTLARTIVGKGERDLAYGRGQRRVTRTLRWKDPGGTGRPLVGFKQLSDVHVIDEESPARVEYFDGCGTPFNAAYRVQEAMSLQVGESMLQRLARIRRGPATGVRLSFAISTGDNIDNNQLNELREFIALLDGDRVDPNSGGRGYHGYTQEHFSEALPDEILELAQEPFDATGAKVPWYAVLGNHDGLVQGNAPQNPGFEAVATGGRKAFVPVDGYENCPNDPEDAGQIEQLMTNLTATSSEDVPADVERVFVDHEELVEEFFQSEGKPYGHGLAAAPEDPMHDARAGYYSFPMGPRIRGISLDTISYDGVSEGHVPDPQFRWLRKELRKWSTRYFAGGGARRNPKGRDRLIVLFSHHSSPTLRNPGGDAEGQPFHCFRKTDQPECADGEGLKNLLHRFPNVIAWVNGHEHNNAVRGFPAPGRRDPARGFWEVNTAAHIDWPQQSRLIEIAWKPGARGKADTIFLYGTVVDHAAAPDPDRDGQSLVSYLSSVSRVEAYYDACVREGQANCAAAGRPKDRNVKLVIKAPFDLNPGTRVKGGLTR